MEEIACGLVVALLLEMRLSVGKLHDRVGRLEDWQKIQTAETLKG